MIKSMFTPANRYKKATRSYRRRSSNNKSFWLGRLLFSSGSQYLTTIVSAILLSAFVFSGFLLFRFSDSQDLLNRGRKQMAQGKVAWASRTFETLVNRHPDQYEGHLLLGQAYLQLGERKKAEQEFVTASALQQKLGKNSADPSAELAMGRLAIARKQYAEAEKQFLNVAKTSPKNIEVRQALFDLYQDWANRLIEDNKPLEQALSKYDKAWLYVSDFEQERRLKSSWLALIRQYTEQQIKQQHYAPVIQLLERSLKLNYDPELLNQLAATHEKKGDLPQAITWYRKAFESNPTQMGLKLSAVLIRQGEALAKAGKTDEANLLFAEAKKVSKTASIPLDTIYPIELSKVKLRTLVSADTDEVQPELTVTFANDAKTQALPYLMARVQFYANDQLVGETKQIIATHTMPLPAHKQAKRTVVFKPAEALNLYQLENQSLVARLSVAYNEGESPNWKQLQAEEITIKRHPDPEPSDTGLPSATRHQTPDTHTGVMEVLPAPPQ
jgi:tetratricopeptide (TPR) repeat protein